MFRLNDHKKNILYSNQKLCIYVTLSVSSLYTVYRYGEKLKLTRKVSVKKHLLSELIEAALHFVIFSTYGLAVWLVI